MRMEPAHSLDTDGDGVYDYQEIRGCTNRSALNYEIAATDDDDLCGADDSTECNHQ